MDSFAVAAEEKKYRFYKWTTIVFLFVLGMLNFADKTVIGFAAVPIMKDLGLTHEQFGLVGSAFFWLFSLSALIVGRLSDRVSSRAILGGMASIWALTQFATVFITRLSTLVATRVVLGAAEGPSYNLSMHAAAKWLPRSERGLGFALVSIGSALGPAVAAPILLYFIFTWGWRSAFILLGCIGTLWVVAWLSFSKETPEELGLASPDQPSGAPKVSVKWREIFPILFSKDFIFLAFAGFASYWGLAMLIIWVPAYLQEIRHVSHAQAQFVEGLPWLVGAISSLFFSYVADRLFRRTGSSRQSRVYISGTLGLIAAIAWFLFVAVPSSGLAIVFLVFSSIGSAGYPLGSAIVADMVLPEHRGTLLGALTAAATSAGLVAPAISGKLIQAGSHGWGYFYAFALVAGLNVIANILLLVGVHPPRAGETPKYVQ